MTPFLKPTVRKAIRRKAKLYCVSLSVQEKDAVNRDAHRQLKSTRHTIEWDRESKW
jgi:hypothetical protein